MIVDGDNHLIVFWNVSIYNQHFCQGALGQKFQLFVNGIFLLQNVFISEFLARIRNHRLRIDSCAKFQRHWTKDKGTRILT